MSRMKKAWAVVMCVVMVLTVAPLGCFAGVADYSTASIDTEAAHLVTTFECESGLTVQMASVLYKHAATSTTELFGSSSLYSNAIGDYIISTEHNSDLAYTLTFPENVTHFKGSLSFTGEANSYIGLWGTLSKDNLNNGSVAYLARSGNAAQTSDYGILYYKYLKDKGVAGFRDVDKIYWKIEYSTDGGSTWAADTWTVDVEFLSSVASGSCGNNLSWLFDIGTGVLNITGTGAMTNWTSLVTEVPWFAHHSEITKIIIDDGVTTIGNYAFVFCNVTNITIPDSVTVIGNSAFRHCVNLTNVTIGNGVKTIGELAFYECFRLANVLIPDSVTDIGQTAFYDCDGLTSVTIPDSVKTIGESAFSGCNGLKSVTIGNGLTHISKSLFNTCDNLTRVTIGNNVRTIGEGAFINCDSLASVIIPDSITTIYGTAFANCDKLANVTIGSDVNTIGEGAFNNCNYLANVYYNGTADEWNAISIGKSNTPLLNATKHYTAIASGTCGNNLIWTLDTTTGVLYINGTGTMYNFSPVAVAPWYPYRSYVKYITISNRVTSIGDYAFYGCKNFTSIDIPDSVTTLGNGVFFDCDGLTDIVIPDSVTTVGDDIFNDCDGLVSITVPKGGIYIGYRPCYSCDSLTTVNMIMDFPVIGEYCFYDCKSLPSITIPNSVTFIGAYAFEGCDKLTDVYFFGTEAEWKAIQINENNEPLLNAAIHYKAIASGTCGDNLKWYLYDDGELEIRGTGAMKDYLFASSLTNPPWYSYRTDIKSVTIGDGVTTIGNFAFYNCDSLENITIPDGVTTIGDSAFKECSKLISITLGRGVTAIGENVFERCESLASITVDENNKYYSSDEAGVLFNEDKTVLIMYPAGNKRTSYTIPESVTVIDDYAFHGCDNLLSVTVPEGVKSIGSYAFAMCNFTKLTLPEGVKNIGDWAFYGCMNLETVNISEGVTSIGEGAFAYCTSLKNISIPDSTNTIGVGAFNNCEKLESINIPAGVTSIGEYAFSLCINLKEITVDKGNKYYSSDEYGVLFNKDRTVLIQYPAANTRTSYTIPSSVTAIAEYAFIFCQNLKNITVTDNVTTIGPNAFYYCTGLESINIPAGVKAIEDYAFGECTSLTDVYYNGTEAEWQNITIAGHNEALTNATVHFSHVHTADKLIETVESTCTQNGYKVYICVCGYEFSEELPLIGHSYESVVTAPTCTEEGYTTYTCSLCSDDYIGDEVAALGHDIIIDKAVDATCTSTGLTEGQHCSRCDDATVEQEKIPALGHDFDQAKSEDNLTRPTSTSDGYYTFPCKNGCSITETESVKRADYSAYEEAKSKLEGYLTNPNLTDKAKQEIAEAIEQLIQNNELYGDDGNIRDDLIESEQAAIDKVTTDVCDIIETVENKIAADEFVKADYSAINSKIDTIEKHLNNSTISKELQAEFDAVKSELAELKKDHDASQADVNEKLNSLIGRLDSISSTIGNCVNGIHVFTEYVTTEAKCTTAGSKTAYCDNGCGAFDEYVIPALNHDIVIDKAVDATCTSTGLTEGQHCSRCDDATVKQEETPMLDHSYDSVITLPTCTADGYTTHTCSVCKDTYTDSKVSATGHSHKSEITTQPGCEKDGVKTFTCSCGDTYTKVIPKLGHSYDSVTTSPTCTEDGYTTHTCSACGDSYIDTETAANGHTPDEWETTVEPGCVSEGTKVKKCTICKEEVETDTIPVTGHDYKAVVTKPTCTVDGYTTHTCSACRDSYTDSVVKTEGHKYNSVVTPNTCTKDGYTTHTCSVCGDTYTDSETKATGHSHESKVAKEPTCTNTGIRTFTCHCGDSYTEVIKAIGHTKGEWEYIGGKEYAKSCTVCGDKLESKIVTVSLFFNGEKVNKKQVFNKSSAAVTTTVTDNFVNDLVFTSSDNSIVSVGANGNVVANDVGKATITVTIKDTAISDSIEVEVLPRDFTITWNVNGKQTKQTVKEFAAFTPNVNTPLQGYNFIGWDKTVPTTMPAENLTFTAQYELLVKQLKIKNPSTNTVKYGETLVMHADFGGVELPEGWKIEWTVEGAGFNMASAEDGLTCKVTSVANGNPTVKAMLVDENGEAVLDTDGNEMSDSKQLKSDASFWQKIVSFFKNLFRMSRVILQSI